MPTLSQDAIAKLLTPFVDGTPLPGELFAQLGLYLDLLLKWNSRTNLTSIRTPEEIVLRHFGESLFVGLQLQNFGTMLDFGSGAGFPGLPIQLLRPELYVTLAESQGKKVSFLREAIRALRLKTDVWPARVEAMPRKLTFDVVTLRAVDRMEESIVAAKKRVSPGGRLALLTTGGEGIRVPMSKDRVVRFIEDVPRGTSVAEAKLDG